MTEAEKERIKLSAGYLNGLAIASFAIGGLAPPVAAVTDALAGEYGIGMLPALGIMSVCFAGSFGLHYAARRALRRLDR